MKLHHDHFLETGADTRTDEVPLAPEGVCGFGDDLGYRGRGRPRLPEGQRRREKLVISLNEEEMRLVMHRSANVPKRPQDWARSVLLARHMPNLEALRDVVEAMESGIGTDDVVSGIAQLRFLLGMT